MDLRLKCYCHFLMINNISNNKIDFNSFKAIPRMGCYYLIKKNTETNNCAFT
jgi:hypothetical protein